MVHGFHAAHKPTRAALFPTPINPEQSTPNGASEASRHLRAEALPPPLVEVLNFVNQWALQLLESVTGIFKSFEF
jgi:hypothetical protein